MNLNNLVQASIFTSIAVGLGFIFMFIPNLEFISITVFLSGITLGYLSGALVGGTSMLIYSTLNPLGSGLVFLPLLISQILAMAVIGFSGGIFKKLFFKIKIKSLSIISGIIGSLCAIWYDGLTTLAYPLSAGYTFNEIMAYALAGLIFTAMHIVANGLIFCISVPIFISRMKT